MNHSAELKEYARLIMEELKHKDEENEGRVKIVEEEVLMETDNCELENVDTVLKVSGAAGQTLTYRLSIQSRSIIDEDGEFLYIYVFGKSRWIGKHRWNPVGEAEPELLDEIGEHIRLASAFAETLFFDKTDERFISRDCPKAMRRYRKERLRQSIFADKRSIKSGNMCCVCNDHTTTKTPCGHELCLVCWEKLEKKTCPLCRHEIRYRNGENE
jgi:hypothetical protein